MSEQHGIPPLDERARKKGVLPVVLAGVAVVTALYFILRPAPTPEAAASKGIAEFGIQQAEAPKPPPVVTGDDDSMAAAPAAPADAGQSEREAMMQREQNQQLLAIAAAERAQQEEWQRKMAETQIAQANQAAEQRIAERQKRMRAPMRVGGTPEGGGGGQSSSGQTGGSGPGSDQAAQPTAEPNKQYAFAEAAQRQEAGYAYNSPERPYVATGTVVQGVLETGLNSDFPGPVKAIVSENVYTTQGGPVGIEKGSILVGEQRQSNQLGQARVYVIWHEIQTPTGRVLPIASMSSDEQGTPAIGGKVDYHFLQRFGAAILISLIDAYGQSQSDSNSTSVQLGDAGQRATGGAFDRQSQIPPTVTVKRGTRFTILVQRTLIL